jgi:voltage-gated sodium channel
MSGTDDSSPDGQSIAPHTIPAAGAVTRLARRITDPDAFETFIALLLTMNGMALLAELLIELDAYDDVLWGFYSVSTLIFVVEIVLRLLAHGPRYRSFFSDPWNVFDLGVTLVSLLPLVGSAALVGRFARLARLARFARIARLLSLGRRRRSKGDAP